MSYLHVVHTLPCVYVLCGNYLLVFSERLTNSHLQNDLCSPSVSVDNACLSSFYVSYVYIHLYE